jgi:putative heme iron utilization protein
LEQTLELVIDNFHSLLSYDFNIDGVTEIIAAKLQKNATEVVVAYPKQLTSHSVKLNERINTMCMARTSVD